MILLIVFLPFLAAVLSYVAGKESETARDRFAAAATLIELLMTVLLLYWMPSEDIPLVFGSGLHFTADGFRCVYAIVTAFMWAFTTLFCGEYFAHEREGLNRYYFFVLMTLGATEGVMLSADLMTAFIFFEILSFTSFTWVIHERTPDAIRAGYTYLFIAVIGGLVLFMGLALLNETIHTLRFDQLRSAVAASDQHGRILAAGCCILFGFGCKAGMFPVHVWLPKAHPVAPSPGSALLSGILTKVGVYGILMTTLGALADNRSFGLIVLILGVITMALGAVLALFSVNLKRTLACSSMSQIGFILTGISMYVLLTTAECEEGIVLALSGTMLHMLNHSLIKLTLFMAAGVVVMNLGVLTLDDIRGWGRKKWRLKIAFALGGLGISGVPGFNGYISKTLLHEGIVEGIHTIHSLSGLLHVVEWIFLISGGLTFAYMLKLFIAVFVQEHPTRQAQFDADVNYMNRTSTAVICGSSVLMAVLGQPGIMTRLASFMTGYEEILAFKAFTFANLKGGLISLAIGLAVYLWIVRRVLYKNGSYVNLWPAWLDLENAFYRPLLTRWLPGIFGTIVSVFGENKVLIPVARRVPAVLGAVAGIFGENRLLTPLCKGLLAVGTFLGRLISIGPDTLVVLSRRTLFRERAAVRADQPSLGRVASFHEQIRQACAPLFGSFSFALMMTCIGVLIILGWVITYI